MRQSEERFRTLFEHAANGIAITDWQGRFVQCNPAYSAIVGYAEEELREIEFSSLVRPDDRAENMVLIRQLMSGERPFFTTQNRYVRKGGDSLGGKIRLRLAK